MGKGLTGKKIVITGSRKTDEMSTLIEKQGGSAIVRSLQGTVFLADKQVEPDFRTFINEGADLVILTTGIGTESLLNLAEKLGLKEQFIKTLQRADVASRGYKTFAVLKKLGIQPVAVDEDGTTEGLIRSLESYDFQGKKVMVQLHGVSSPSLINYIEAKGGNALQILPYQHIPPEKETVKTLCGEILKGEVDAICFTTAIQVHSLFSYAKENGIQKQILDSFLGKTLAVAVGKVTAEGLREENVERYLAPDIERMGAMIIELAKYYEKNELTH